MGAGARFRTSGVAGRSDCIVAVGGSFLAHSFESMAVIAGFIRQHFTLPCWTAVITVHWSSFVHWEHRFVIKIEQAVWTSRFSCSRGRLAALRVKSRVRSGA